MLEGAIFLGKWATTAGERARMGAKRAAICRLRMVPMRATPTVPPMVRKNCVEAVATPRTFQGTAFCTEMMKAVLIKPKPLPITDRKSTRLNSQSRQYLVCRLLLEKKKKKK